MLDGSHDVIDFSFKDDGELFTQLYDLVHGINHYLNIMEQGASPKYL